MFEPFYIDTQEFKSIARSHSGIPSQLSQMQNELNRLAQHDPQMVSTIPEAGCQALAFEINLCVSKILAMHINVRMCAAQLGNVSASMEKTLEYLRETAEDMEQTESAAKQLEENWSSEWMNGINRGA